MTDEDNNRKRKMPPSSDEHRPVSGKKDTKRWCRGKVGIEHKKKWALNRRMDHSLTTKRPNTCWTFSCTECGKEFDYCTEYLGRGGKCKCGHHGAARKS